MSATHELKYREQARENEREREIEVDKELDSNVKDEPFPQQTASASGEPVSGPTKALQRQQLIPLQEPKEDEDDIQIPWTVKWISLAAVMAMPIGECGQKKGIPTC